MAYFCFLVSPIVAHVWAEEAPELLYKVQDIQRADEPFHIACQNLKPGHLSLMAENVLGPRDVSLDSQYTGTFDVRAKASTVQVLQSSASDNHLFLLRKVGHGQRWRRRRWETRAAFCGCLTGAGPWLDGTTGDWKSLIVIHWAASSS
jgi:hypothetical protein